MVNHIGPAAYREVADHVRGQILSGALPVGTMLPPISHASRLFNATPSVIKRAWQLLSQEGFVVGHRGKGVFVRDRSNDPPIHQSLDSEVAELQEIMREVLHRLACIEDALADQGR